MSSFNPLTSILNQNKLEGPNYVDWKRSLDIVLTAEGYKFIITEECPKKLDKDATDNQSMGSAYDMLESLKEMFSERKRAAKQTTMKALLNTKMAEGSSVLGTVIDKESQVEMVLQTLPDSFQQFRLNYNMNKMDLSLAKLLNELQASKGSKKKKKAQKVLAPGGATAGVKKPKGKCYHCKQSGHHKRQCPTYLAKLNKQDSGAINHICTTLQGFQEMWQLSENAVCIF
ncbi:uncharacterized protein LOC142180722 [Nicotiana tabacum]|uniref:Uncharacterized protein LOC142180722 n=1 Tax=Nicotiana tabacum TaxID=4097 RepID=A0AC58UHB7_TOBAC